MPKDAHGFLRCARVEKRAGRAGIGEARPGPSGPRGRGAPHRPSQGPPQQGSRTPLTAAVSPSASFSALARPRSTRSSSAVSWSPWRPLPACAGAASWRGNPGFTPSADWSSDPTSHNPGLGGSDTPSEPGVFPAPIPVPGLRSWPAQHTFVPAPLQRRQSAPGRHPPRRERLSPAQLRAVRRGLRPRPQGCAPLHRRGRLPSGRGRQRR